jgi:hypothetical protein
MLRVARSNRPRLTASLVGSVVLAAAMATGLPTAEASSGVTDLETTALRISGGPIAPGGLVPSGATLTLVHLMTSDPESSDRDGFLLQGAVPETRIKRQVVVPGSPAEQATFRIDGAQVASSVPSFVVSTLQTNTGSLRVAIFTAGGVSYAIPRVGQTVTGVDRTVASTRLLSSTATSLSTPEYGLVPVGAQPRTGLVLRISGYTGAASIGTTTVLDADAIRGNADAVAEEQPTFSPETEVLATVTLSNGAIVAVRGLRFATPQPYGVTNTSWFFDRSALAAAGATVADVTGVISFAVVPHDLTWDELGFDLI